MSWIVELASHVGGQPRHSLSVLFHVGIRLQSASKTNICDP